MELSSITENEINITLMVETETVIDVIAFLLVNVVEKDIKSVLNDGELENQGISDSASVMKVSEVLHDIVSEKRKEMGSDSSAVCVVIVITYLD